MVMSLGRKFVSDEEDGGFYKSILIDSSNLHAYVGARFVLYTQLVFYIIMHTADSFWVTNSYSSQSYRVPQQLIATLVSL